MKAHKALLVSVISDSISYAKNLSLKYCFFQHDNGCLHNAAKHSLDVDILCMVVGKCKVFLADKYQLYKAVLVHYIKIPFLGPF